MIFNPVYSRGMKVKEVILNPDWITANCTSPERNAGIMTVTYNPKKARDAVFSVIIPMLLTKKEPAIAITFFPNGEYQVLNNTGTVVANCNISYDLVVGQFTMSFTSNYMTPAVASDYIWAVVYAV